MLIWRCIYIRPGARCHRVFEKKSTFSCNAKSGAWKRKALPLFFRKKKEDFQLKHEQECWWKFSFKNQNFYTGSLYPLAKKNWLSVVKRVLWTPVPIVGCVNSQAMGKLLNGQKNEAPLQTTELILREDTSAFWYEKEAEESVDGRWSYLDRFLNLSHQMLPSRNTLHPNKKNTNPSNTKTYTTETSEYKLSKCYCFTGKDVEFMKYRVLSSYL